MVYKSKIVPNDELLRLLETHGIDGTAKRLGFSRRWIQRRRRNLERLGHIVVRLPESHKKFANEEWQQPQPQHPGRISLTVTNGIVIVGSDAHYWPGPASLMHRFLITLCKEFKPSVVVMNGDVCDFPSISRYPPIGWQKLPTPAEEIEAAGERLHEIEKAAFRAQKIWTLGNHDQRFSTRIALHLPELAKVKGVSLKDHFPLWEPTWSVEINRNCIIKHRFRGGIHAVRNNVLHAGRTMVTGHLHSAKVTPFSDYNGVRWGVDTGCIADPNHVAFLDFTEDNPKDWRDGICVLTFRNGQLMPPELVYRWSDDEVVFRGEVIRL